MSWRRVYITVEGDTERAFCDLTLKPHLANREVELGARVVVTNRKLGKRGGVLSYATFKGDIHRLLKQQSDPTCRFTSMIDLYALPESFPGWDAARKCTTPIDRVRALEAALSSEIGDPRFTAFIQLHEFEALLFCDLNQLQQRIDGSAKGIAALRESVDGIPPEDINEDPRTAPSKRIVAHVPIYERLKVRVGAHAAAAIQLHELRARCPHFHEWVSTLEGWGNTPPERSVL